MDLKFNNLNKFLSFFFNISYNDKANYEYFKKCYMQEQFYNNINNKLIAKYKNYILNIADTLENKEDMYFKQFLLEKADFLAIYFSSNSNKFDFNFIKSLNEWKN